MVKVPDERLTWLAEQYKPKKVTPAELEFLDLPGLDLRDEAGRKRAKEHWASMRQADMLVMVLRNFHGQTVPAYRDRIDPKADLQELLGEMLFADLDQVSVRMDKLETVLKKPSPKKDEQGRELDLMKRLKDALENEKPVSQAVSDGVEDKLLRGFGFLSQKPSLAVLNVDESGLAQAGAAEKFESLPCVVLSAKIEEEIAQLPPADRTDFLADLGLQAAARDRLIRACYASLKLVSFLTVGEDECRAWTVPSGTDAVTAAAEIHSDIARGFIRAETVAYADLYAAGDMKGVKAAGKNAPGRQNLRRARRRHY